MPENPGWLTPSAPAMTPGGTKAYLHLDASNRLIATTEGNKASYRAAIIGITPVATPTDILQIIGSATKTCRIKKIALNGVATAQGNMPVQIVRRSALGTQGTATVVAITPAKLDTADGSPTMSIGYVQTANWTTPGASAGVISAKRLNLGAVGTGTCNPVEFVFSDLNDKPLFVKGTSDYVCINMNGAAVPAGGLIDIAVEWEEE